MKILNAEKELFIKKSRVPKVTHLKMYGHMK
jgi:hypothetical protein